MIWKVNGQEYNVIRLATLLGIVTGAAAGAFGLLLTRDLVYISLLILAAGLAGSLTVIIIFLVDLSAHAKAEGEAHRARLRAAKRVYTLWAEGEIEPPTNLHTATYRVDGEVRPLSWLQDDDPEAGKWRALLVALFTYGRAYNRESRGERTGLTEVDMVGTTPQHMFPGREGYLAAIKVARDLGLVDRTNGLPTTLGASWTWTKIITYLQTAAVLPPIKEKCPTYRHYTGAR